VPTPTAEFEVVHTVHHWWDGPRAGFADFRGEPHVYSSSWDAQADDWSDVYALAPIDRATFALAREDWAIWRRWQAAYHAGHVAVSSGPALPDDRARSEELKPVLRPLLEGQFTPVAYARAEFRRRAGGDAVSAPYDLEVRWQVEPGPAAAV
jgi:hypothetical protein